MTPGKPPECFIKWRAPTSRIVFLKLYLGQLLAYPVNSTLCANKSHPSPPLLLSFYLDGLQAPVVHPYQVDLFPGVSRGGGYQLWAPYGKGPPLRTPPGDTLPELEATEGRHIIGKVRETYDAEPPCEWHLACLPFTFIRIEERLFLFATCALQRCGGKVEFTNYFLDFCVLIQYSFVVFCSVSFSAEHFSLYFVGFHTLRYFRQANFIPIVGVRKERRTLAFPW